MCLNTNLPSTTDNDKQRPAKTRFGVEATPFDSQTIESMDSFLELLARHVDVDLMPGELDPCPHFLPQQPIHLGVFGKSHRYNTLHSRTNPHSFNVNGVT
jgi:DNA polymerase II small subunit/DNA polymerase delta subunit B